MSTPSLILSIRWGGLLALFVAILALHVSTEGPTPVRYRTDLPGTSEAQEQAVLDEPPRVPEPDRESFGQLEEAASRIGRAMMYVGHPEGASGTAFVISREHRLLATNAHVAEIMQECGAMVAYPNGSRVRYQVERAWFHPDYARVKDEGTYVNLRSGWAESKSVLSPDIAVLQLSGDGPDLPQECRIAGREELDDLDLKPVGLLGFSGPWPARGDPMVAVFKAGTVSLLTEFTARWDRSRIWRMVDFAADSAEGDSGGPIFLPEGRIIAIHAWSRTGASGRADRSVGLRIDALWDLLDRHKLTRFMPPTHRQ